MEVKFKAGDSLNIPEGCKAVIKDNVVVFEREEKFKDGDILVPVRNGKRENAFIYKGTDKGGFHSYYVGMDEGKWLYISKSSTRRWCNTNLSYATEEEKKLLFDKMKEQGLKWNAEEKKVEKIRWRAPENHKYWYCSNNLEVVKITDCGYNCDYKMYNCGNYFRTEEQAEEAAKRIKKVLYKYHEEIGE